MILCKSLTRISLGIVLVVPMGIFSGVAQSQVDNGASASSGRVLEEVIVTAQKRAQSVQDIPIAIDVFTGDKITDAGVSDLDDLAQVSSSYSVNTGTGSALSFIRGIGSNVAGTGTYSSVAVYVDGAYRPRGYSLATGGGSLEDVESLQVLKGPQGSLYGRNATGGALVITTKNPQIGDDFSGSLKVNAGDFGVRKYGAKISGGISDQFAGSLSVSSHESDGFVENLSGGRGFDDEDGYSISGKLVFAPTENIEFVLSASFSEDVQNTLGLQQVAQGDTGAADAAFGPIGLNNPQALFAGTVLSLLPAFGLDPTDPLVAGTVIGGSFGIQFSDQVGAAFNNQVPGQTNGVISGPSLEDATSGGFYEDTYITLNSKFSFDTFDLIGITAYNDHIDNTTAEVLRADPSTLPDLTVLDPNNPALAIFSQGNVGFSGFFPSEAFSQEIYAVSTSSDIEWIAGLYYFTEDGLSIISNDLFGLSFLGTDNEWETESIAGYGQVTYPFNDQLDLIVGGRYTSEDYDLNDFFDLDPVTPGLQGNAGDGGRSDSQFTYNVKLAYNTDNWLFYGGVSTGFKSGSINAAAPTAGEVSPEEITSIELGFKANLFGNRVRLNGSIFDYDYENIQLFVLEASSGTTILVDGTEAEVQGLELEIEALVSDSLTLFASTTLLDTEYTTDAVVPATIASAGAIQPITGNQLALAADTVVIAGIDYRVPLSGLGSLSLNGSVKYNSGFFIDQLNTFGSSGADGDSFTTANANLKYISSNENWSLAVYINNLTDEEYFRGGLDAAGGLTQQATAGRTRHWGVTAEYNF